MVVAFIYFTGFMLGMLNECGIYYVELCLGFLFCNFFCVFYEVLLCNLAVRMLREELQLLQEPGSYVGEVVKIMGKSKVLVKVCQLLTIYFILPLPYIPLLGFQS